MIFLLLLLPASIQVVLNWIRMMTYVTDTDNIPVKVPRVIWKNPFPLRGPTLSISVMRFSVFCLSNYPSIIRSLSCKGLTKPVMAWYPSSKIQAKSIILIISPMKKQKKPKYSRSSVKASIKENTQPIEIVQIIVPIPPYTLPLHYRAIFTFIKYTFLYAKKIFKKAN